MREALTIPSASPTVEARRAEPTKTRLRLRPWLRAFHRDIGYAAVGLTVVYAISGLALNHIQSFDSNFKSYSRTEELGPFPAGASDAAIQNQVLTALGIDTLPRDAYRASATDLEISFDKRSLHVDTASGQVVDEGQEPRFFLRVANWLHLNRGKKAWTHFADFYAGGLLFLAVSGMFMLPGRKGLLGRGAVFVALGIAVPIVYVMWSGGP
jgi:hypothetical protein